VSKFDKKIRKKFNQKHVYSTLQKKWIKANTTLDGLNKGRNFGCERLQRDCERPCRSSSNASTRIL